MEDIDGQAIGLMLFESLLDGFGLTDQQHLHAIFCCGAHGALDFHCRGVVGPHCVNCDLYHDIDLFFGGLYNFTSVVVTAVGTGAMRQLRLMTVGALRN